MPKYLKYKPSPFLSKYIEYYWELHISDSEALYKNNKNRIIPDGSMELIFHFNQKMISKLTFEGQVFKETGDMLIGQVTKPYFIFPQGSINMIGVRFRPVSANLFFKFPIGELNNDAILLKDIWGSRYDIMKQRMLDCKNSHEKIICLDQFLYNLITPKRDTVLERSTSIILHFGGRVGINVVAKECGVSTRYLQRVYQNNLGFGPKHFSKIIRFRALMDKLQNTEYEHLTSLTYNFGFFDQSHFIRDFKYFTGTTPKSFLKESCLIPGLEIKSVST